MISKKLKLSLIILLLVIISGILIIFNNKGNNLYNGDIKLFNSLQKGNNDIKICDKIINVEIGEKCRDNYYSIKAFEKNDKKECEYIVSDDLKKACINSVLKFK